MRATTALLELFKEEREWRRFFRSCCETGTHRLVAQAWHFGDELKERGYPWPGEEVEDALLGLARELLPDSAAAGWSENWAHELCKDTLNRLEDYYAGFPTDKEDVEFSAQETWDERMYIAGQNNNPVAFRAALKGWERAGLEAIERARTKGGAA